jgi:hypothetical protein
LAVFDKYLCSLDKKEDWGYNKARKETAVDYTEAAESDKVSQ